VLSCFEVGRDGFWVHQFLVSRESQNIAVDFASIEVNRRKRRAKSAGVDATKLVSMLVHWHKPENKVWAAVRIPAANEDRRQLRRELIDLKAERARVARGNARQHIVCDDADRDRLVEYLRRAAVKFSC
jgi:transposase